MKLQTKKYIKTNLTPLLIGLCIGLLYSITANLVEAIIIKIALIYAK
jgi:hypothetical protein